MKEYCGFLGFNNKFKWEKKSSRRNTRFRNLKIEQKSFLHQNHCAYKSTTLMLFY